jgi:hypothetical protein
MARSGGRHFCRWQGPLPVASGRPSVSLRRPFAPRKKKHCAWAVGFFLYLFAFWATRSTGTLLYQGRRSTVLRQDLKMVTIFSFISNLSDSYN